MPVTAVMAEDEAEIDRGKEQEEENDDEYTPLDLGSYTFPQAVVVVVTTSSATTSSGISSLPTTMAAAAAKAQVWFDRGMVWCMAFHHEEAIYCFQQALGQCHNAGGDSGEESITAQQKEQPENGTTMEEEDTPSTPMRFRLLMPMAHWMIAYAHGPNYNVHQFNYYPGLCDRTTDDEAVRAYPCLRTAAEHARSAVELLSTTTTRTSMPAVQVALIRALPARYPTLSQLDNTASTKIEDKLIQTHLEHFVDALRPVYDEFGTLNADVAYFMAEALLQLTPWNLYPTNNSTNTSSNHHKQVKDIQEALGRALTINPNHPGANHLLIHCCEMSPTPQQALPACARLLGEGAAWCPHLVHMPSHIYLLLGRYHDAVAANRRAIEVDRQLYQYENVDDEKEEQDRFPLTPPNVSALPRKKMRNTNSHPPQRYRRIGTDFYTGYVYHDYHTLVYGAMLGGMEHTARRYGTELEQRMQHEGVAAQVPEDLEGYSIQIVHVLVRFGRWQELLARFPLQPYIATLDPQVWPATLALVHYGRAVAYAALGNVDCAEQEEVLFAIAAMRIGAKLDQEVLSTGKSPPPRDPTVPTMHRQLHNNTMKDIVTIAGKVVKGEILYRKGKLLQDEAMLEADDNTDSDHETTRHHRTGTKSTSTEEAPNKIPHPTTNNFLEQAFATLREGILLEDNLAYDEPWGWMMPVRHPLGGLLLEQGRVQEAGEVFRADLTGLDGDSAARASFDSKTEQRRRHNRHPSNIFSLVGLEECFARGLPRIGVEESEVEFGNRLTAARAVAEVDIPKSCACVCSSRKTKKSNACSQNRVESSLRILNGVTITNPHLSVTLPKLKYGYRTTKATFEELHQIITVEHNVAKLTRSEQQQHVYEVFMYHMKEQYVSTVDYILISKFGFDAVIDEEGGDCCPEQTTPTKYKADRSCNAGASNVLLVRNDFPYYCDDSIVHYVLWKIPNKITSEDIDRARHTLRTEMKAIEILHWENPPNIQSIAAIDHVHFLCRVCDDN